MTIKLPLLKDQIPISIWMLGELGISPNITWVFHGLLVKAKRHTKAQKDLFTRKNALPKGSTWGRSSRFGLNPGAVRTGRGSVAAHVGPRLQPAAAHPSDCW